jgi:Flp pilus assembly protein TadG
MVDMYRKGGNLRSRRSSERGASLVEFAIMAPLLILLLLGIIEFGWLFSQNNDVRHGAREAARLAAVDAGTTAAMGARVCDAMDVSSGATITFTDGSGAPGVGLIGSEAIASVATPTQSLTGFFDGILPATLTSEVRIRLEQNSDSWSSGSFTCPL